MPYRTPTTTLPSVAEGLSSLDEQHYWIKVRKQVSVQQWPQFAAVDAPLQDWLKEGGVTDMPLGVAEVFAAFVVDWNFDDESDPPQKIPVSAEFIRGGEFLLGDLLQIVEVLREVSVGKAQTAEEQVKNSLGSTSGSRESQESSRLPDTSSNGSQPTPASIAI